MSDYFLVCNATKREYFDMEVFGDWSGGPWEYNRYGEPYLYTYGLVQLCVTCTPVSGQDIRGRWQGDRFEFVSANNDHFDLVVDTYTSISLVLLDGLCSEDPDFLGEILRRALCEHRYNMPVSSALLTLLDDPQYEHFRQDGIRFHNESGGEDCWGPIVASLREHYAQYYRGLNTKPPDDPRMHFR